AGMGGPMNEVPEALRRQPVVEGKSPQRSLVIPVYRNAETIAPLIDTLVDLSRKLGPHLEIVFVVDGSPDDSAERLIEGRKRLSCESKIVLHSRNFGSFTAIRTGLELASGNHIAAMAADLQEPPELITTFFERLDKDEADIIFGQRTGRDDPRVGAFASR